MSCSRTQHGGGRFRTPDLSLRSPTLYHWATALPHFNFKPNCRAYPSVYLIQLRDYGEDTIFVKGRWCINQESESCPSCSQHMVLIRYTYLWSFVTIFLTVQKLWPINNILPRPYNSTAKNQGYRFCLFHIVLMRYIFPGSFLKIA